MESSRLEERIRQIKSNHLMMILLWRQPVLRNSRSAFRTFPLVTLDRRKNLNARSGFVSISLITSFLVPDIRTQCPLRLPRKKNGNDLTRHSNKISRLRYLPAQPYLWPHLIHSHMNTFKIQLDETRSRCPQQKLNKLFFNSVLSSSFPLPFSRRVDRLSVFAKITLIDCANFSQSFVAHGEKYSQTYLQPSRYSFH